MWAFPRAPFELGISKVGRVRLYHLQNNPTSEFPPILIGAASFQARHPLNSRSLHLFSSTPAFYGPFQTGPIPSGSHLGACWWVSMGAFVVWSLNDPAVSWWALRRPLAVGLVLRWVGGGVALFRAFVRGASATRIFFFDGAAPPQTSSYHC